MRMRPCLSAIKLKSHLLLGYSLVSSILETSLNRGEAWTGEGACTHGGDLLVVVARLTETRQQKTSTSGAEPFHHPCSLPAERRRWPACSSIVYTFYRDGSDATAQVATRSPSIQCDLPNISEQVVTSLKLICRTQLVLFAFINLHPYWKTMPFTLWRRLLVL